MMKRCPWLVCSLSHFARSQTGNGVSHWNHPQRFVVGNHHASKLATSCCGFRRKYGRTSFLCERGGGSNSSSGLPLATGETVDLTNKTSSPRHRALVVLKELARRLDEPKPLRSSSFASTIGAANDKIEGVYLVGDELLDSNNSSETKESFDNIVEKLNISSMSLHDLAIHLCQTYHTLPPITNSNDTGDDDDNVPIISARQSIVEFLAIECSTDSDAIQAAIEHYQKQTEGTSTSTTTISYTNTTRSSPRLQSQERLRQACTNRYETILSYLLQQHAQWGMRLVLSLRKDLFQLSQWRESLSQHRDHTRVTARLLRLDSYIRQLLITWFSPGMIETRRITYEQTSAAIMEEIATKEAVHPMRSLEDLKVRLGSNRRVFCLFHPLLPDVPLVFVHVALQSDIPTCMDHVLKDTMRTGDQQNQIHHYYQKRRHVAVFYSISNAQAGLAGVGLGEYLIKNAVKLLQAEFAELDTFCTLSPIPRFRRWMTERVTLSQRSSHAVGEPLLSPDEALAVAQALGCSPNDAPQYLLAELEKGPTAIDHHPLYDNLFKPILLRLGARYICLEKHHGKPLDAVARFHIGNGAQVYRINAFADTSRKGWHNSFGLMVNYRYHLPAIPRHQSQYEQDYRIPICNDVMELLLRQSR